MIYYDLEFRFVFQKFDIAKILIKAAYFYQSRCFFDNFVETTLRRTAT